MRIFYRDRVDPTIINTQPKIPVFLLHEEETSRSRRCGTTNQPLLRSLLHVLLHDFRFILKEGIDSGMRRFGSRQGVNRAVPGMVRRKSYGFGWTKCVAMCATLRRDNYWKIGLSIPMACKYADSGTQHLSQCDDQESIAADCQLMTGLCQNQGNPRMMEGFSCGNT